MHLSARAARDILGIIEYITRQLQAPDSALSIAERIQEAIDNLTEMPERYAMVANERPKMKGIRRISVGNDLVFFTINQKEATVNIITVQYNRHDWGIHL